MLRVTASPSKYECKEGNISGSFGVFRELVKESSDELALAYGVPLKWFIVFKAIKDSYCLFVDMGKELTSRVLEGIM